LGLNCAEISPKGVDMSFIGRKTEWAELKQFLASDKPQIAVLYGRRRVGKRMLILNALEGRSPLMFDGLDGLSMQEQIRHFRQQLQESTGAACSRVCGWEQALQHLCNAVRKDPQPVVLGEFQWMASGQSDLVSLLKSAWDHNLSQLPAQKLILCGSTASFMIDKVIHSSALSGRITTQMHLRPFTLAETREMLPGRSVDEILLAQMLTGGVPQYLEFLSMAPSIPLGLQALAFKPSGHFTHEYGRIFTSHFGRNPAFEAIIRALAAKPRGLMRDELTGDAGLSSGGQLTEYLRDLESAGFVSAEAPFHRGEDTREIRYRLSDAYLSFYFDFIRPNLRKIKTGQGDGILSTLSVSGALTNWLGHAFERMCVQHEQEISKLLGFSAVDYQTGPYFVPHARGAPGLEVDLVFDRDDDVLTVCELKYATDPVGVEVISTVQRKMDLLRPVAKDKTIQPVLIVHPRASRDLLNKGYFYKVVEARQLIETRV
jgi:uncharacterized protein